MVISGGNFKPDTLKPKEVVSLLLDDEELEKKRMYSKPLIYALIKHQKMFLWPHTTENGRGPWLCAQSEQSQTLYLRRNIFMSVFYIKTQISMCYGVESKIHIYYLK